MAARLGARVAMVSRVGRDVFGEQILHNFREQGVETAHVRVDSERSTGTAAIVVDDRAQNAIIVVPGANLGLSPADVDEARAAIQTADVVLCQLEVPLETTLAALRLARQAGVRTILNPAPAGPLPDELLALTDLCVPNETETELLTGQAVTDHLQIEAAARILLERGPGTVIVTLGDRGALVVDQHAAQHFPAVPVQALDSAGAGDVFIGSLAVFWAEGAALPEAVRRANAVAALSVTRLGTQAAFPTRSEVLAGESIA
jgi:ribokinase